MSVATADGGRSDMPIARAIEMFLDAHQQEYTEETIRDYSGRLSVFREWCESESIEKVGELDGWTLEQFRLYRQGQDLAPTTMKGQMATLKRWLDWLVDIEAVDEGLPPKVTIPTPSREEETSDISLPADRAQRIIDHWRGQRAQFGSAEHALFELTWWTGARLGAMHALDLDDVDCERGIVEFRHRVDTDTPLKKKSRGERAVGVPEEVADALRVWRDEHRPNVRDRAGRDPFWTTNQGRATLTTLRNWLYSATIPCRHSGCPHDKDPRTCEWTSRNEAYQCPSSRSPHQIRTGSITWQLNRGMSWATVGERVNSDPDTLRRYYDKASERDKLERRRDELDKLDFEEGEL